MTRARRGTPKDPERAREAILDAAARRFSRRGFRGTRVSDVAHDAGYSEALVYFHFTSKAELFREVLGRQDAEPSGDDRTCPPEVLVARLRDAELRYHQDAQWRARDAAWVEALAGDPTLLAVLRPELGSTLSALQSQLARFDTGQSPRLHTLATLLLAVSYGTRVLRRYHADTLSIAEAGDLLAFAAQAAIDELGGDAPADSLDPVGNPTSASSSLDTHPDP